MTTFELENTVPLLDLNMPVMDGFQVLENLISISHTLKVIIVTSSISDEDRKGVVLPLFMAILISHLCLKLKQCFKYLKPRLILV
jgi:CheY-like chemotaxis protein